VRIKSLEHRRRGVLPVIRFGPVPGLRLRDVVLRANECLREAGIKPVGVVVSDEPHMMISPRIYARSVAVLTAAGFKFTVE
jgi:hypothetical protein